MNLTLNVFELHQCLVSLLRKTQNTFSEQAVKKIGWWEFLLKKKICHQTLGHINRTMNLFELHQYIISLLMKMQNTISEPAVKKNWVMGICSRKGNLSTKHRSHQQDRESIWITSVPYFLIEKNAKYIFRASGKKKWVMGNFPKKEIINQMIENYFWSCFRLTAYVIWWLPNWEMLKYCFA